MGAASPGCARHLVHFYADEDSLRKRISEFLIPGLAAGEGVIVIATREHNEALTAYLEEQGIDIPSEIRSRRFVLCDAGTTLSRFMVDSWPHAKRFDDCVGTLVRELRARSGACGLRAYGEMVDLLWNGGHSAAAIRLEQLWNDLLAENGFQLMCAYQIDIFGTEFQSGVMDGVLRTHTHVVPASTGDQLDCAVDTAINEVLGCRAESLKHLMRSSIRPSWADMPRAQARILWLRGNLPDYAAEICARARAYYSAALSAVPA